MGKQVVSPFAIAVAQSDYELLYICQIADEQTYLQIDGQTDRQTDGKD